MIPLVKAEDVTTRRGRGGIEKYEIAVEKHLEWIKKSIESSKDGTIRMKITDFAKELGPDFVKKSPVVIQRNLKSVLFNNGIIIESGLHRDGEKLLIMRFATKADKLDIDKLDIDKLDIYTENLEEKKDV